MLSACPIQLPPALPKGQSPDRFERLSRLVCECGGLSERHPAPSRKGWKFGSAGPRRLNVPGRKAAAAVQICFDLIVARPAIPLVAASPR
jgi:hypothetical protein